MTTRTGPLLATLLMAPFLAQADATITNVATPAIHTDLGASGGALELVIGGYLVAYAVLLITGARLGQTHGLRRVFVFGLVIFGLASLAGGLAPNVSALIVTRVVQGAGAALMYPQAITGIQLNFTGRQRVRAIGLLAMALSAGAVTGQLAGGMLISLDIGGLEWRPIFLVNVPICAAVLLMAMRNLPRDGKATVDSRVDVRGIVSLSVAVLLLVIPLTIGRSEGWPLWTWACFVASAPAALLFVLLQRRTARPLVNVAVFRRPTIMLGLAAMLTSTGTYYALLFTIAQYFQQGLGRSAFASGVALLPWVIAFGLAGQITQRVPGRFHRILPAAGYLLLAAAYFGISAGHALPVLLALGGLGLGTGFAPMMAHVTNSVDAQFAPDISGVSATVIQIGGAIAVAGFGSLYLSGSANPGHAFSTTTIVMGAIAAVAAAAAYLSIHVERRGRSSRPAEKILVSAGQ
jgi:predicted MFS family arabinose efflux permease